MSIRGVWVFSGRGEHGQTKIIFSRRYATVERRAQIMRGKSYCPIPSDVELGVAISSVSAQPFDHQYSAERDSCSIEHQYPVIELMDGQLWPVVLLKKFNFYFVAIPLVETTMPRPPLVQAAGVSVSLSLLEFISDVLLPDDSHPLDENSPKLQELYQLLCVSVPLGTVLDCNLHSVRSQLQLSKAKHTPMPKQKQPSWRPMPARGTGKLLVAIKEQIRAVQYDQPDITDYWEVFGTVMCKAELDGSPEILFTLSTPSDLPPLDPYLVVHSGVQPTSATSQLDSSRPEQEQRHKKIRFSAPSDQFTLCHYQASSLSFLPVRGFYQMKGDTTIKVLVQLKLNESVKNSFEFFDVQIPFFNRGPIDKVDSILPATVAAALALSEDRKAIIWTIGQRFPTKSLEVSLQATVHFHDNAVPSDNDDPFCCGLNAYIDLFFKVTDYCLSGLNVESKSLTLFPSARCKLITTRELSSNRYRIWNSHGDVQVAQSQIKPKLS